MADKRVTFSMGPMKITDSKGAVMWQHHGQEWLDLPQVGAVLIQKYMVDVERKLTAIGDLLASGISMEEMLAAAQKNGLIPF
jgi:hypothetical protein